MTRRHGLALLCAIVALIALVSAGLYVTVAPGGLGGSGARTAAAPHNSAAPASTGAWVATWAAAPSGTQPGTGTEARTGTGRTGTEAGTGTGTGRTGTGGLAGRSVRNVVHTSVGGTSARITLSNLYGTTPLTITHASLAVAASANTAAARPDSMRRLTFGGRAVVVVPVGGQVVSDPARVAIPYDGDVLVTTYSPAPSGPVTVHRQARQISYVADGDRTESVSGVPYRGRVPYWGYLTSLDVLSHEAAGTVVAFGDSITDGSASTVGANRRWPDVLADRLRAAALQGADVPRYGVVNAGISGNQVLADGLGGIDVNPSGLSRFRRDALDRAGVRVVVIDLGINDILRPPRLADPERVLAGLRTLVRQAHASGLRVIGATLMPFGGRRGYSPAREAVRQRINAEIRAGRVYDAVVDFDAALRDPYDPRRLRAEYDCGDHLHPSDLGYRRMAESFDLRLLRGGGTASL